MPFESRHLPLTQVSSRGFRHGNRSYAVCHWKCGNECDLAAPNTSENETFAEVVDRMLTRRTVLSGALASGRRAGHRLRPRAPRCRPVSHTHPG